MKLLLTFLAITFSFSSAWLNNYEAAKTQSLSTNRPILLYFSGSDWCGICHKMKDKYFENTAFKNYAEKNLVLLQANFPRLKKNQLSKSIQQQNEILAEKYNPEGVFPCTILLSPKGAVLKRWEGIPTASPENFMLSIKGFAPTN